MSIKKTMKMPDGIDNKLTGEDARKQREKAGLSLREMAELMSTSSTYVFDLEHGNRNWNEDMIKRYETALKKASK